MQNSFKFLLIALLVLLVGGCSGNSSDPVAPAPDAGGAPAIASAGNAGGCRCYIRLGHWLSQAKVATTVAEIVLASVTAMLISMLLPEITLKSVSLET